MTQDNKQQTVEAIFDILLTGNDVARILNVSRSFAYILMRRGEIPTVRIGRSVRVRPGDLERFIEANITETDGQVYIYRDKRLG